jgi:DNA-binding transcriptional ArsR family regulator
MVNRSGWRIGTALIVAMCLAPQFVQARAAESKRMERAKDLIADEQWVRAIDEFKAAADDPKEPNKAEALFWLAHSQNQARDAAAAFETIRRLERQFPTSPWVKPAQSLRIEIAQRLGRKDFLWYNAIPPTPPAAVAPAAPPTPAGATPVAVPVPPAKPTPPPAAPRAPTKIPKPVPPAAPTPDAFPGFPMTPPPAWVPEGYFPDMDQRIQALARLMATDAPKVIPILKAIALESTDAKEGRRALIVLAQSDRPDARDTVIDVAKTGPEPIRVQAVRALGRLNGPAIVDDLMQVYAATANESVKYEVVTSLAQRDAAPALFRIVQSEKDRHVRDAAIVTLGEAGGRKQLTMMYAKASADIKRPIIVSLFNAQADEELIRIAEQEKDPAAREEILTRLRLLGTPKAKAYLAEHR